MALHVIGMLAAILFSAVVGQAQAPPQKVDVTGAWDVTITMSRGGSVSGLAVLSQDGPKVTGTGTRERLLGTIDTNRGTIEFVRKKREGNR
jgi:hypothetical protein